MRAHNVSSRLGRVSVTVTGSGSLLDVGSFTVSKAHQYFVLNGGTVDVDNLSVVAAGSVLLDGGTLRVGSVNSDYDTGFGWLDFRRGTLVGAGNMRGALDIPDDGHVVITENGHLEVDMRDAADGVFVVGDQGHKSTLTVSERGRVYSAEAVIGRGENANGLVSVNSYGELTAESLTVGGEGGRGTLLVESDGRVRSYDGFVGRGQGSVGVATVRGKYSFWEVDSRLRLGSEGGHGTLVVEDGGIVSSYAPVEIGFEAESVGSVTVRGEKSLLDVRGALSVGGATTFTSDSSGKGELTVEDGDGVIAAALRVGSRNGEGTVTVRGTGSYLQAHEMEIGKTNGKGVLRVEGGGRVVASGMTSIGNGTGQSGGDASNGAVVVTERGSELVSNGIRIGDWGGNGTLSVEDGGTVVNDSALLMDSDVGAVATVTVQGAGSSLSTEALWAYSGTGRLVIADGGVMRATNASDMAFRLEGGSFLQIAGETFAWQGDHVAVLTDLDRQHPVLGRHGRF